MKVAEERRNQANRLDDTLVVFVVMVLQPQEKGRQITSIITQILVVVNVMDLFDKSTAAGVMEVVQAPTAHSRDDEIPDHSMVAPLLVMSFKMT